MARHDQYDAHRRETQFAYSREEQLERSVDRLTQDNASLRDEVAILRAVLEKARITEQERAVHKALGEVWNQFSALPVEHQQDAAEFCHHVHILQRMVSARAGRRQIRAADKAEFDEGFCDGRR